MRNALNDNGYSTLIAVLKIQKNKKKFFYLLETSYIWGGKLN